MFFGFPILDRALQHVHWSQQTQYTPLHVASNIATRSSSKEPFANAARERQDAS